MEHAEEFDSKLAEDLGISVTDVIKYRRGTADRKNEDPFGVGIELE